MSMSVGSPDGDDGVMGDINTTPLVDIMLVLLIIFLLTIPAVIQVVPVKLPDERNQPTLTKPENINISVDSEGKVFWNQTLMSDYSVLLDRARGEAIKVPQPEVHIRGDRMARYEFVGRVVVIMQRAGIVKIGFITEPPPRGG
jgi:biopolymer transport protein ExbD